MLGDDNPLAKKKICDKTQALASQITFILLNIMKYIVSRFFFLCVISVVSAHPYDDVDWGKRKAPNGCVNSSGSFWCEDKAKGLVMVSMPAKRMQYLYAKIGDNSGFYVNYCKDLIPLPTKTDKQAAVALKKGDYEKFYAYVADAVFAGDFIWTCMGERKIRSVFCLGNKDWNDDYYVKISKYDGYGILDSEKEISTPEKDYCKKLLDAVE